MNRATWLSRVKDYLGVLAIASKASSVQSVICAKTKFKTAQAAAAWCRAHRFSAAKVDETSTSFRFRQFEPSACQAGSFHTISLTEGVSAVICTKKQAAA